MTQVSFSFHSSVHLPVAARGLAGALAVEQSWSVGQLASAIERHCAQKGIGVRVVALLSAERGHAVPPHEPACVYFGAVGSNVVVLADVRSHVWPSTLLVKGQRTVPVTVFTGFLGSGKTTVLNHLLRQQRERKVAVIENEFGEVPIDNELLENSAMDLAEQVVVMENGCMCCTLRGDLLGAFDAIRRQMQSGVSLDAVLVETTGMADPLPIVRTIRNTPDIAKHFHMDGTITLVDCKTVLSRLGECKTDDQERHRQISFADKILLSKIDLVDNTQVAEVWKRLRSFNDAAPIVAAVKGVIPPAELTNLGAFDMDRIAAEQEQGHGHEHDDGHGNGHDCGDHDCDAHGETGHDGGREGHGHAHSRDSRHESDIGSFSIVKRGVEIDPLAFARWVRVIATLPEQQGILYRSKGIIAAAGRSKKLIFHAVADVTETQDGPEWGEEEQRICKMVFIGNKLDREAIEKRFNTLFQPSWHRLRPLFALPSPSCARRLNLTMLVHGGLLHATLFSCWTKDVLRVSQASALLRDAIFAPSAFASFRREASAVPEGKPRGLQTVEGDIWLHGLMPTRSIEKYVTAWRNGGLVLSTSSSMEYLFGEPLMFFSEADLEAAGVMWQEVCELKNADTLNHVIEFKWRPETMKSFFDVQGSATNSSLVKITVESADGDSDLDDDLKFRINLNPEENPDTPSLSLHRMSIQLVGGKTSNFVYAIFFHTINPTYQVHISVPDHRVPIFPTKEVFHQWHPLMSGLQRWPRLRFLLRLKQSDSGPLDAMCGCCG